jgi:hypothetical protein
MLRSCTSGGQGRMHVLKTAMYINKPPAPVCAGPTVTFGLIMHLSLTIYHMFTHTPWLEYALVSHEHLVGLNSCMLMQGDTAGLASPCSWLGVRAVWI